MDYLPLTLILLFLYHGNLTVKTIIFQTFDYFEVPERTHSFKYQSSTTSGYKDLWITNLDFGASRHGSLTHTFV